jgi:RNA polymerase sigma-70 factor, ECF subfamily
VKRENVSPGAGKRGLPAAVFHMRTPSRRVAKPALSHAAVSTAVTGVVPKQQASLSRESELAARVKALVVAGDRDGARERFADLVARQQRRAVRIAYNYLRDAHDADEAVQDAFLKVFTHITSYREEYPFEVWFTRILVNGCLDLRKARARRLRWAIPMSTHADGTAMPEPAARQPSPEDRVMSTERAREITSAVEQLPDRQRLVFTLCHIAEHTTSEVSQSLGLSEATVRVHLFRAVRKLRKLLTRDGTRLLQVNTATALNRERSAV